MTTDAGPTRVFDRGWATVLVGGDSPLGVAVIDRLAPAGVHVVAWGPRPTTDVARRGGMLTVVPGPVDDEAGADRALAATELAAGPVVGLVSIGWPAPPSVVTAVSDRLVERGFGDLVLVVPAAVADDEITALHDPADVAGTRIARRVLRHGDDLPSSVVADAVVDALARPSGSYAALSPQPRSGLAERVVTRGAARLPGPVAGAARRILRRN